MVAENIMMSTSIIKHLKYELNSILQSEELSRWMSQYRAQASLSLRAEFIPPLLGRLCLPETQLWPLGRMEDTDRMGSWRALKLWDELTPLGAMFQEGRQKRDHRSQNSLQDPVLVLMGNPLLEEIMRPPKAEKIFCIYVFNEQLLSTYYLQST